MCEIKEGFKLCTCGELTTEEADWILHQKYNHGTIVSGTTLPIYLNGKEEEINEFLSKNLNERQVFDFEYNPREEDILEIKNNFK